MDDPCFYGFPIFGEQGPKVGQDAGGKEVTADTRTFEPDQDALGRVQEFLGKYIPSALGPIIYTKSCLYTLTPDRDFVLDAVPGHPNVIVAIGGGHGFKFASLIGRILPKLAIDGTHRAQHSSRFDSTGPFCSRPTSHDTTWCDGLPHPRRCAGGTGATPSGMGFAICCCFIWSPDLPSAGSPPRRPPVRARSSSGLSRRWSFYLPLMFTVLELSSRYPNEGGCYVWSKRAFGDFAGFITGWTYWSCNLPYFPRSVLLHRGHRVVHRRAGLA